MLFDFGVSFFRKVQISSVRRTRLKGRWVRTKRTYRRRWPELWALTHHPPTIHPAWLGWEKGQVPKLAAAIEKERRWSDLPVLADALEEAGCTDADVLGNCRGGEHARGCWVVDRLLGKP